MFSFYYSVRCINEHKSPIIEGEIRSQQLSNYLDHHKTTRYVWLSEDATAIISKVIYDPATNQLVGLVLPTNKVTGCPTSFSYLAQNAEMIKKHLEERRSTVVYLVMAQPLDERVPPYVVQLFGSDNRFDTEDVVKRWKFTVDELAK